MPESFSEIHARSPQPSAGEIGNRSAYIRSLHRLALLTAAATFPLIFMGGLVTSHKAGMSVPDWPNTYGYNMFTFPPSQWVGGIFYEHTHRLMGSLVGLLSIALVIWTWRLDSRKWVRWLSVAVLVSVIIQGVLGGLRVILVNLDLAVVHGCFAQAFFCLAGLMCVVTSRWWHHRSPDDPIIPHRRLLAACAFAVVLIYTQLIVGAMMRHYDAGLAIPDLPLAYGKILPPITGGELEAANSHRIWSLHMPTVTMLQVWLHFGHRIGAVLVTIVLAVLAIWVFRRHWRVAALRNPTISLIVLLVGQITLGVLTVLLRKPADIASAHVAVGALTLLTAFVLTIRIARISVPAKHRLVKSPQVRDQDNLDSELIPAGA